MRRIIPFLLITACAPWCFAKSAYSDTAPECLAPIDRLVSSSPETTKDAVNTLAKKALAWHKAETAWRSDDGLTTVGASIADVAALFSLEAAVPLASKRDAKSAEKRVKAAAATLVGMLDTHQRVPFLQAQDAWRDYADAWSAYAERRRSSKALALATRTMLADERAQLLESLQVGPGERASVRATVQAPGTPRHTPATERDSRAPTTYTAINDELLGRIPTISFLSGDLGAADLGVEWSRRVDEGIFASAIAQTGVVGEWGHGSFSDLGVYNHLLGTFQMRWWKDRMVLAVGGGLRHMFHKVSEQQYNPHANSYDSTYTTNFYGRVDATSLGLYASPSLRFRFGQSRFTGGVDILAMFIPVLPLRAKGTVGKDRPDMEDAVARQADHLARRAGFWFPRVMVGASF